MSSTDQVCSSRHEPHTAGPEEAVKAIPMWRAGFAVRVFDETSRCLQWTLKGEKSLVSSMSETS